MGYSRAGAGALIFSKEAPDVLWGMGRCLWSLGALPELMVWDREGAVERLQGYLETNFEPGRRFANQLDFQLQLDVLV